MVVWADLPGKGESAAADFRQRARIVDAKFMDAHNNGKRLFQVVLRHVGEHCSCWPSSVLYFGAARAREVYGLFNSLPYGEMPKRPEDLFGREVFARTPGKFSNATYGIDT